MTTAILDLFNYIEIEPASMIYICASLILTVTYLHIKDIDNAEFWLFMSILSSVWFYIRLEK